MVTVSWKRLSLILMVVIVAGVITGHFVNSSFSSVRDVSIGEIVSDLQSFVGAHVRLRGYVADTSAYMFGPKYTLREFDGRVEIALGGKGVFGKSYLEPYVSFVFDGENYTQIRNIRVNVLGYIRYMGPVTDAPSFYLEVEKVEPSVTELETIVIEFLNTTDVPNGGWNGTVEVKEIYDHKLDGKVMVVRYTTSNGGIQTSFWKLLNTILR